MPTYEYVCRECDHNFEVVQSFADEALTVCPSCGGPLRKVFSPAGIIFKGSGYYVNDSRTASTPASAGAGDSTSGSAAGDGGDASGGDSSKTDSSKRATSADAAAKTTTSKSDAGGGASGAGTTGTSSTSGA